MDIKNMDRDCVLLDERAYVLANSTAYQLINLEEELKQVSGEYTTVFQLEALYRYYAGFGMKAHVISIVAQIQVDNSCIISVGNSSMKVTRVSENFCVGEWLQENYNYNYNQQVHNERHYHKSFSYDFVEEENKECLLLCN